MRTFLLLLTLVFLTSTVARATLSETDAQIETRYGPAMGGPHPGTGCYWKNYSYCSMNVIVIFIDGKSEYERFDAAGHFSAADIKALLDANTPNGSCWYRPREDGAELSAEQKGLSLLFNRREIATASVSDYAVFITSEKYQRLHLHTGNYSWPPERSNIPNGSPR